MKKTIKVIICSLCLLMLSACTNVKHYVSYTIYPLGYLLERIGGDRIQSISIQNSSLVQTANIVDDFEEILKDSYHLFHVGYLEPYFELYQNQIAETEVNSVDLSTLNAIYRFQRYSVAYVNGVSTFVEGPYYEGDVFDEIDMIDSDLFLWLDPIGMLSMAKDITRNLSNNYVEESGYFKQNCDKLENDLISLDASYQALATKLRNENKTIKFVSMTASFGNWQKAYGFQVYPICLSKYGALPTESQLALIKQRILDDGVQYIAYEPNMTDEMLALFSVLEDELNLKRVNLNNISSLTATQLSEGEDYLSLMKNNLSVLENMAVGVEKNEQTVTD